MTEYEALDAQLRRWLNEDEQLATCAAGTGSGKPGGHWKADCRCQGECREYSDCERVEGDNITIYDEGGHNADQARHIARWDPAAVLADNAGKRALLEWAYVNAANIDGEWDCGHTAEQLRAGECAGRGSDAVLAVLRCVAAGYVDRPEFKAEWRLDA